MILTLAACTSPEPLSGLDAGPPTPAPDAAPALDSTPAGDADALGAADARSMPDTEVARDADADSPDAMGPVEVCGDTVCGARQVCAQICGEDICAGTAYGVSCLDSCGCVVGFECNDLSLRCTPCAGDGQCDGGDQCLRGPGVCAPRLPVRDLSDLLRVVIECAANIELDVPHGCAELDTSMGLVREDGEQVESLEPLSPAVGCGGLLSLTEAENLTLRQLLGCDEGPMRLQWSVALPTGLDDAGCVYTLPAGRSGTDEAAVVVDECETPPHFAD